MLLEGERLRQLIVDAKSEVVLCSPFIKAEVLRKLLSIINPDVAVKIYTRWHPTEVAAGVSDLEVFEISKQRPRTELALLSNLHAKMYLADDIGLVGSANLTATALGWAERSNVELLISAKRSDSEIVILLNQLRWAIPATFAMKSQIEEAIAKLSLIEFQWPEARNVSEAWKTAPLAAWLPRCATPEKLYMIYRDPNTRAVIASTRDDAIQDLCDLNVPEHLENKQFSKEIASALEHMPAIEQIIKEVPRRINDAGGVLLVAAIRPDLSKDDAVVQWAIVRDWIREFFSEKFEVAADHYVVRIRPS